MDIGGGLIVSDAATGLSANLRVRMLLVHQDQGVPGPRCVPIVQLQPGAVGAVRVHGEGDPVLGWTGRKRHPGAPGAGRRWREMADGGPAAGGRLEAQGGAMHFELGIDANRRESPSQGTAEHGVLGWLTARW